MGLESSFNFIDDLNSTNPAAGDNISEGDDHIRGIKNAVKGSFTSLGSVAVTKTAAEINDLVDKSSAQTISGAKTFSADVTIDKATPALSLKPTDEATEDTVIIYKDDLNNFRAVVYRPAGLDKLRLDVRDVSGVVKAALDITESGDVSVAVGTFKATDPVIDGGISGTALETTITNTDTKIPTSGAVFDKVAGLNTAVFDIGDWNMDANASVNVAHGVTLAKIRDISALIRDDSDTTYTDINISDNTGTGLGGLSANATNIVLNRLTGGPFDTTFYDSITYNRGWVTIKYID